MSYSTYGDAYVVFRDDSKKETEDEIKNLRLKIDQLSKREIDYKRYRDYSVVTINDLRSENQLLKAKNRQLESVTIKLQAHLQRIQKQAPESEFKKSRLAEWAERLGETCPICYEKFENQNCRFLNCGHVLCDNCLGNLSKQICPECREPFDKQE